jgi:hypothetical protein
MKGGIFLCLGMIFSMTNTEPAHVQNTFQFIIHAPLRRAAALFGPDGERCWAGPRWNPEFLYPQPPKDVQGAVFKVQHGPHNSVWVNTLFDLEGGRMQYVAFIPDVLVTTVDVRLTSIDPSSTKVEVDYARTAVDAAANENVEAMGKSDRDSGPQWQQAIEACLVTHP